MASKLQYREARGVSMDLAVIFLWKKMYIKFDMKIIKYVTKWGYLNWSVRKMIDQQRRKVGNSLYVSVKSEIC